MSLMKMYTIVVQVDTNAGGLGIVLSTIIYSYVCVCVCVYLVWLNTCNPRVYPKQIIAKLSIGKKISAQNNNNK